MKVATQDWHPFDHVSFASNHPPPNNKPFDSFIEMKNHVADRPNDTMQQRLWPVHCVQGTKGADLIDALRVSNVDVFVKKGSDARVEMYSAFSDSFGNLTAGHGGVSHDLAWLLKEKGVEDVFVVGVAGDYCVKYTAIDASKSGFNVFVVEEAVRCVDPNAWDDTKEEFAQQKVHVVPMTTQEVQNVLVP
jgi:nicotinamidase-related amidase